MNRADFYQHNAERAKIATERLLAQQAVLGARWLSWVASELYALTPPEYAVMVRREQQQHLTST